MSSSFPTSWEPYGSSQQNAALAWRRTATLPSQQPPPLTTRWQSTQDAPQASPLPSLDPSQRVAPEISAFQANDREQKSVARFESLREEMQQVTAQLRQLNANIQALRSSQSHPFPALIAEVSRLSQLIGELMQRPGVHGHQSNLEFAVASSEKRVTDTVLAITDLVTGVQTSCAAFIPRLDSGLGSVERLIHAATSSVAADVPKWFEVAFQQMAAHHVAPMLQASEARVRALFEKSSASMVAGLEKHVSMAVGNGVAQVLNRISLEQTLGAQTAADLFAPNDVGETKSQTQPTSMPSKDANVKLSPKDSPVERSEKDTTGLPGPIPLTTKPPTSQRSRADEDHRVLSDSKVQPETTAPLETAVNPKLSALLNGSTTADLVVPVESKKQPQPVTQNGVSSSKEEKNKVPARKEEDSAVEEIDIFGEGERESKAKPSKTKEKEANLRRNGKRGIRQARQRKQDYTAPSPDPGTESSESKEPSEEEGEEESEWECDQSEAESQSSGLSHGGEGFHRPGSKRMKKSFARRSKRRRRT
ncbi:hypothetical protein FGB62_44g133 [Gracilaria domingensis]|nr:hypothetical protein FGB62_44g133 [Gracilaria domingensis]